ncbi:hypothetical protein CMI48_03475, partial [Candidatus Pacearchaeota archaeon]|nr:hypothetical protein [Candidatus Pacearchaeota archaeon]
MADKETEKMIEKAEEKEQSEEEAKAQEVIKQQEKEEEALRALPPRERRAKMRALEEKRALENWVPKTAMGKEVKTGKLKDIDSLLDKNRRILEPQMIDILMP